MGAPKENPAVAPAPKMELPFVFVEAPNVNPVDAGLSLETDDEPKENPVEPDSFFSESDLLPKLKVAEDPESFVDEPNENPVDFPESSSDLAPKVNPEAAGLSSLALEAVPKLNPDDAVLLGSDAPKVNPDGFGEDSASAFLPNVIPDLLVSLLDPDVVEEPKANPEDPVPNLIGSAEDFLPVSESVELPKTPANKGRLEGSGSAFFLFVLCLASMSFK